MNYDEMLKVLYAASVAQYWTDLDPTAVDPYIGQNFFPAVKQMGLRLEWLKGYNQTAVVLQPSTFDTKASIRGRISVDMVNSDMPFFREAMRIGEKERQDLLTAMQINPAVATPLIGKLYDDVTELVKGAIAQTERMRFQVLTSGAIAVAAKKSTGRTVKYAYNYDPDGTWAAKNIVTLSGTAKWDAPATSTPVQDVVDLQDTVRIASGYTPTKMLMNTVTFRKMMLSASIRTAINTNASATTYFPPTMVKQFMIDNSNMDIQIYDKLYIDETATTKKYLPDGYVILLPNIPVGKTCYGTTPEEFDAMNIAKAGANVSVVNTGVAITTIAEAHPVNLQTIVSQIVLPSFELMSAVGVLKAF
jgi:hypothetical protein